MNPFDCESATGGCSNSIPRDPRRFAISLNTATGAGLLIRLQGDMAIVSQAFQIPSPLLYHHSLNDCSLQWHHIS